MGRHPLLSTENIIMMRSRATPILILMLFWMGCGEGKTEKPMQTEVLLTLAFPEHLTESQKESLKEKIVIYCFQYYGSFPERGHQPERDDVDAKRFQQYSFSDLPFDEHLKIVVNAFDTTHQIRFCRGETEISYFEGKQDRVQIRLDCGAAEKAEERE